jgi:hypothetical protein
VCWRLPECAQLVLDVGSSFLPLSHRVEHGLKLAARHEGLRQPHQSFLDLLQSAFMSFSRWA